MVKVVKNFALPAEYNTLTGKQGAESADRERGYQDDNACKNISGWNDITVWETGKNMGNQYERL